MLLQKLKTIKCFFFVLRNPSSNADEYKRQGVELIGWGSKTRTGAVSSTLKRITLSVFTMRYFFGLKSQSADMLAVKRAGQMSLISNLLN
jgi:hypothetical protein